MHRHVTTPLALVAVLVGGGCGDDRAPAGRTVPADQRSVTEGSSIVLRGDYGPDQHGPFVFTGRYDVRFVQRGAGVDFGAEVPFTAHLERPAAGGPVRHVRLFQTAARSGRTTISAHGRFRVVVDFGDSPYVLRFTRAGG